LEDAFVKFYVEKLRPLMVKIDEKKPDPKEAAHELDQDLDLEAELELGPGVMLIQGIPYTEDPIERGSDTEMELDSTVRIEDATKTRDIVKEEPTVEEPTVKEPTVEEPTVEEPTVEPTILNQRAYKKWKKLDVDSSGTLEGEEGQGTLTLTLTLTLNGLWKVRKSSLLRNGFGVVFTQGRR